MYKLALAEFRRDRQLDGVKGDVITNVKDEALEVAEAITGGDTDKIVGEACDVVVFIENYLSCFTGYKESHCQLDSRLTCKWEGIVLAGVSLDIFNPSGEELLDALSALKRQVATAIENNGYDFNKCMDETCKKILSRTGEYCSTRGKWCKFESDSAKASWYEPDYASCKKEF